MQPLWTCKIVFNDALIHIWNPGSNEHEAIEPSDLAYWVLTGMPMGWTWALYFAQSAVEAPLSAAVPYDEFGAGGFMCDGRAAPFLGRSAGIAAA